MNTAHSLVSNFPVISEQVTKNQLQVILHELEEVLQANTNGAVVEFGCYIGTTSLFIQRLLDAHQDKREFHVYDSFEGLPAKARQDASPSGEQFVAGELSISKKAFIHEFHKAGLQTPKIHKGWFEELQPTDLPEQISFAFLDGDFYDSIRDSLLLVLPRMTPGGVIIFDDYAHEALPGVARAVKEFLPQDLYNKIQTSHNLGIVHL